jgi:hypothetical protein
MGKPDEALEIVQPSLVPSPLESTLRMVEALTCRKLGRIKQSREAAARALACARSEEQRQRLCDRLSDILREARD